MCCHAAVLIRAWREGFTITLVSGRTVGIGAYLARLGRRCVQRVDQPIILTGYNALNKVLGRQVRPLPDYWFRLLHRAQLAPVGDILVNDGLAAVSPPATAAYFVEFLGSWLAGNPCCSALAGVHIPDAAGWPPRDG
jgi:hypothetical protein